MRPTKAMPFAANSKLPGCLARMEANGRTGSAHSGKRARSSIFVSCGLVYSVAVAMAISSVTQAHCGTSFESTQPMVRVEYWQKRLNEITSSLKQARDLSSVSLVFLGDSITDFWTMGDNPWLPGKMGGLKVWNESFAGQKPENRSLNLGISGDRTEHVLYRLLPQFAGGLGELDAPELNPQFVIVLIGINNTWAAEDPVAQSVYEGIRAVVVAIHDRKPKATVILESLLPTNDEAKNLDVVRPVNQHLIDLSSCRPFSDYVIYLDLYSAFVDPSGRQLAEYFNDGLHPSELGYRVWRDRLVPLLDQVRASKRATPAKS